MNIEELREQLEQLAGPEPRVTASARDAVRRRVRSVRRRQGATTALAVVLVAGIVGVGVHAGQKHPLKVRTVSSTTATAVARDPQCLPGIRTVPPKDVPRDVKAWASGAPVVGGGELWTIRSAIAVPPDHQGKIWYLKFPWFTRPFGLPKINGRRLDGAGTFHADANQAIDQRGVWVVSGLEFSTPGCWEVTARDDRASITFRLLVGNPVRPLAIGTIAGTLRVAGGPAPGVDNAIPGVIRVSGPSGAWEGSTDGHGAFRVDVGVGRYRVTGTNTTSKLAFGGMQCSAFDPVMVARGRTTNVRVICPIN